MRLKLFFSLTLCVSGFLASVEAADWAQWRGPNRDGHSSEKGLLAQWPEAGPKLAWQAKNLGAGFSTPSVVDGRVFVIANQGMEREDLVALSVSSGEKLWSTTLGSVGKNEGPQYPGSRSTPTVDGDRVYALGSDGDLCCLDAKSGNIVWKKVLKSDFSGSPGQWAYTESPLIDGETLICSPGGSAATVVALNKKDGKEIWRAALSEGDKSAYASPVITTVNGTKQYVLFLGKGAVGLKAATGEVLWRYTKTADQQANIHTPVVKNALVYTAASRVGSALIDVTNPSAPQELYFGKGLPAGIGGSVLVGDYLYGTAGQVFACVEFATGKIKWQDRSIGPAAVCFVDGKIILHGENNEVAMIEASSDAYKLIGKFSPPDAQDRGNSKAWTHPVVADGKLYIRDQGSIWCYLLK